MIDLIIVTIVVAAIFAIIFYNFYFKRLNLPPGPTPLPLIGNLHSILMNPPGEKCFLKWYRKYGEVYTYWISELPIIAICGHEKMIETFQKDGEAYAGRFTFDEFNRITRGDKAVGVIQIDGPIWQEHRRFAIHTFRDFGVGKNVMQERILDVFESMAARLDQKCCSGDNNDDEIDIAREYIDPAVGSVINNILFGYSFEGDRMNEFHELKSTLTAFMRQSGELWLPLVLTNPKLFGNFPFIRTKWIGYQKMTAELLAFFERQIEEHRKEINFNDLGSPATDYVEAYLKEQIRRNDLAVNGDTHTFTNLQLKSMCFDLWIAGQESSSTTIAWGIAYLINHPSVIEKAHAELDNAIGVENNRLVTVADKTNLPYINAIINEIQRVANLLPNNLIHRLTKDVVIDGFSISKGTAIVPQISVPLIDELVFENPFEFRPERFLDADGKLGKCEGLLQFSIGKRQCLGESLARMELFLFIANLLNRYTFVAGKELPSLQRKIDFVVACPNFTCKLKKRL